MPAVHPSTDLFLADPGTYRPRFIARPRVRAGAYLLPYALPAFQHVDSVDYPASAVRSDGVSATATEAEQGFLRLDVQPSAAQVYVDDFFIGSADEVDEAYALDAGLHRVELKADGFETTTFAVRIRPNDTVTFTRLLRRLDSSAGGKAAPKTLYVIPRCYAGDRPPVASQLPAGCQVAGVRTIAP